MERFSRNSGRSEASSVPAGSGLVHGDYRIANTVVRNGHITAVIDWELAYLGDRRYDLGYVMLEYLAGKFVQPGSLLVCGVAEAEWFLAEYERLSGARPDREVLRTYGGPRAALADRHPAHRYPHVCGGQVTGSADGVESFRAAWPAPGPRTDNGLVTASIAARVRLHRRRS